MDEETKPDKFIDLFSEDDNKEVNDNKVGVIVQESVIESLPEIVEEETVKQILPEHSCYLCWFKMAADQPMLRNLQKRYTENWCTLNDMALPKELTCESFMADC